MHNDYGYASLPNKASAIFRDVSVAYQAYRDALDTTNYEFNTVTVADLIGEEVVSASANVAKVQTRTQKKSTKKNK